MSRLGCSGRKLQSPEQNSHLSCCIPHVKGDIRILINTFLIGECVKKEKRKKKWLLKLNIVIPIMITVKKRHTNVHVKRFVVIMSPSYRARIFFFYFFFFDYLLNAVSLPLTTNIKMQHIYIAFLITLSKA